MHQVSLSYLPQVRAYRNIADVLLPLRVYRLRSSPVDAGARANRLLVQPQNGIKTPLFWSAAVLIQRLAYLVDMAVREENLSFDV